LPGFLLRLHRYQPDREFSLSSVRVRHQIIRRGFEQLHRYRICTATVREHIGMFKRQPHQHHQFVCSLHNDRPL
jgi:hypothetical protein